MFTGVVRAFRKFVIGFVCLVTLPAALSAATTGTTTTTTHHKSHTHVTESAHAQRRMATLRHSRPTRRVRRRHRYYEHFSTSSFADNITAGDVTTGEDPIVRAAAIDALGNMNGTVVAIDPTSGRILTMINQELALSEGAQPCSTIKVSVALAGLSEGVITDDFGIRLTRYRKIDLSY